MRNPILRKLMYGLLTVIHFLSRRTLGRTPEPSMITDQESHVNDYNKAIETVMILPYVLVLDMVLRARRFANSSQIKAVDLCCGPGHFTRMLTKNIKNCVVTGVDLSEPMLKIAVENAMQENLLNQLQYLKSDVMNLEAIKSNSIDIVSFMDGAHHMNEIQDVTKILIEADRIAKADGLIIMLDPVRPKTSSVSRLYETIAGQSYADLGLKYFIKDFHNSLQASWTPEELFSAIPKNSRRKWIQLTPFGFPSFQIIVGVPNHQEKLFTNEGLSNEALAGFIKPQDRSDWDMLHLSFKLASQRILRPADINSSKAPTELI